MTPSQEETNVMMIPIFNESMTYVNVTVEPIFLANLTTVSTPSAKLRILKNMYFYGIPPMVLFCIISIAINIKILMAVFWIRRPMSPTLHISLSLAAADAYTSTVLAVALVINSWIPMGFDIQIFGQYSDCFLMVLEALRLGGIITMVFHLLALAFNHYLGILKPLHYASIMTHRITTAITVFLWLCPVSFFMTHFSLFENDGFRNENCTYQFLRELKFRAVFMSMFMMPLILMIFIYAHIFILVRRHQAGRLRFTRTGSQHARSYSVHNGRGQRSSNIRAQTEQQMARNIKAIFTTLLILGSFALGLLPSLLVYILVCDDCQYPFASTVSQRIFMFYVYNVSNTCIILKTLVNPIVYAARMHEIKIVTHSETWTSTENETRGTHHFNGKMMRPARFIPRRRPGSRMSHYLQFPNQAIVASRRMHARLCHCFARSPAGGGAGGGAGDTEAWAHSSTGPGAGSNHRVSVYRTGRDRMPTTTVLLNTNNGSLRDSRRGCRNTVL